MVNRAGMINRINTVLAGLVFSAQVPLYASIGAAGAIDHRLLQIAHFISCLRMQLVAI
jgi:hypothetical protein